MLFKTLLVLLAFARAQDVSPVVNITECSVEHLTLRVLEKPGNAHYLFIAACKDHGTCVDGRVQLGTGVDQTVGSLLTLPMGPNCTLGNTLSPSETGRCTLLISSSNALLDTESSFTTDCTLSPPVSSTSEHSIVHVVEELSSSAVKPNSSETSSTATTSLLSTPELVMVTVVPLSLLIMLLTATIVMNFVMRRMRYSKIRSRQIQLKIDFHDENDKWNTLFSSKDDEISRGDCTVYDSMDLNEEESDSELAVSDELCLRASAHGNCDTDSTAPTELPLQTTCRAGYIQGHLVQTKAVTLVQMHNAMDQAPIIE